jgi:hypothetical protein
MPVTKAARLAREVLERFSLPSILVNAEVVAQTHRNRIASPAVRAYPRSRGGVSRRATRKRPLC